MSSGYYSKLEQDCRDFGNWLAGFVDAEGCFHLSIEGKDDRVHGRTRFALKVRWDDVNIIRDIQKFIDCGVFHKNDLRGTTNPQANLNVNVVEDLSDIIIPLFEKYPLRAKKARDFQIWKKGVEMLSEIKSRPRISKKIRGGGYFPKWTDVERKEFSDLCDLLKETRRYKSECYG